MPERRLPKILGLLRLLLPRIAISNVALETSCFERTDAAAIRVSSVVALVVSTSIRVFTVRAIFSLVVGHAVGLSWSLIDWCVWVG